MGLRILFIDDEFADDTEDQLGSYMSYYDLELKEHSHQVTRSKSTDDAYGYIDHYVRELTGNGHRVDVANSVDKAAQLHLSQEFDLVILDVMMPPGKLLANEDTGNGVFTGLVLAKRIREKCPDLPIILLSNVAGKTLEFQVVLEQGIVTMALSKLQTTPSDLASIISNEISRRKA